MSASAARVIEDLQIMLMQIDELAQRLSTETPPGTDCAAPDLGTLLTDARAKISELKNTLTHRVQDVDQSVRDNAWKSIGTAAAVGFVVGVLMGRR